jgi:hypothetical protein
MWRRLNREDLTGSSPLLPVKEQHYKPWPVLWRVYRDYEILSAPDGSGWHYIQAVGRESHRQPECVRAYNPFIDTPYLFLEFARIVERKEPWQELLGWFEKYGLPGITEYSTGENREFWRGLDFPQIVHDDKGGPQDRIEVIWELAYEANESLVLYEAALGRDEEKLERAIFPKDRPESAEESWQEEKERNMRTARALDMDWVDYLVHRALVTVNEYATGPLIPYTYPVIAAPDEYLTVDKLTRSWGARNLLGAMGLQFYWLITSAGELSRCKYCGRVISYAPPIPGSDTARKPRKDKEFCDSRCRQNYHYHYRIKPGR